MTSPACTSSQLIIPVCLVRQSPDLAKMQHQQIGICRLNLEVCFPVLMLTCWLFNEVHDAENG